MDEILRLPWETNDPKQMAFADDPDDGANGWMIQTVNAIVIEEELRAMRGIAILFGNAVQFYSIEPLLKGLDDARIPYDLIIPDWSAQEFQREGWTAMQEDLEELLNQKNIPFLRAPVHASYMVSLSPYPMWWDVKAHFKVCYGYGYITKASFSTAPENKLCYDYILCYGKIDAEFFSVYAKTCMVGEPKLLTYQKSTQKHKTPKLLYLPTYGAYSSIGKATPELKKLSDKFEIIAKAHHGTSFLSNEKNDRDDLTGAFSELYDEKTPLYDLLSVADVVLSDDSGALCDAIAAGVPVARFSTARLESVPGFVPSYIEFAEKGILPSTDDPAEIPTVLERAMTDEVRQMQAKAAEELFYDPKKGSENFLALMRELLSAQKRERFFSLQCEKNRYREERKKEYESLKTGRIEAEERFVHRLEEEKQSIQEQLQKSLDTAEGLRRELQENRAFAETLQKSNQELHEEFKKSLDTAEGLRQELQENRASAETLQKANQGLQNEIKKSADMLCAAQKKLVAQNEKLERFRQYTESHFRCYEAQQELQMDAVRRALDLLRQMLAARAFKLIHFWGRVKRQLFSGGLAEKRNFFSWLFHRSKANGERDRRFQPLLGVVDTLEAAKTQRYEFPRLPLDIRRACRDPHENGMLRAIGVIDSRLMEYIREQERGLDEAELRPLSKQAQKLVEVIQKGQYRGILVYPCVVNWEPLQTPQQILRAFAQEGWLCLFCDYPGVRDDVIQIEKNIYLSTEKDVLQAAAEEPVTILLTWMGSLPFVDHFSNKKIWYHILDQLDIFALYDNFYETLHAEAVKKADWVSFVAMPLQKCIAGREDAIYLPNGCFVRDLNAKAFSEPKDLRGIIKTGHKIIGYFGYVAEWMDYELVKKAALARPDYEFVFIGDVVVDVSDLRRIPNIHFLGLKKYDELPAYACKFDVATIPFLINPMMDCVSPIKFYEYCAYGKPVISSRMKELERYECEFIACVDDLSGYLEKLDLFLKPEIAEMARKNAPQIAKNNSWTARAKRMEKYFERMVLKESDSIYKREDEIEKRI